MTVGSDEVALRLKTNGVIAIIRGDYGVSEILEIGNSLLAGSLEVLEVTLNSPGALLAIAALRERFGAELLVGAGTVRTAPQFAAAVAAGALSPRNGWSAAQITSRAKALRTAWQEAVTQPRGSI